MLEQTMPLDQAFNLIDQALANVNANRETHAILTASVVRIKEEIVNLGQQLLTKTDELQTSYEERIRDLQERIKQLEDNPPARPLELLEVSAHETQAGVG